MKPTKLDPFRQRYEPSTHTGAQHRHTRAPLIVVISLFVRSLNKCAARSRLYCECSRARCLSVHIQRMVGCGLIYFGPRNREQKENKRAKRAPRISFLSRLIRRHHRRDSFAPLALAFFTDKMYQPQITITHFWFGITESSWECEPL